MAKIDINFNNTNYTIDEASLSSATATLRTHLSTVMNGSGAVINLGGTSYGIDSAKLSAAANSFVSHLGTVAAGGDTLTWDGNTAGLEVFPDDSFYRVSDVTPTYDDLINGGTIGGAVGTAEEIEPFTAVDFNSEMNALYLSVERTNFSPIVAIIILSDVTMDGTTLKAGTYFFEGDGRVRPKVRSLQINGYTGFDGGTSSGTKLTVNGVEYSIDPEKVAGAVSDIEAVLGGLNSGSDGVGGDTLTWDGNTEGFEVKQFEGMTIYHAKVSDEFIPISDVIGGKITLTMAMSGTSETNEYSVCSLGMGESWYDNVGFVIVSDGSEDINNMGATRGVWLVVPVDAPEGGITMTLTIPGYTGF